MGEREQLEIIEKSNKAELSRRLGISRQTLYLRIKKRYKIDEIYNCAINQDYKSQKVKNEIEEYKNKLIEKEKEIELLKSQIEDKEREIINNQELKNKYTILLRRYRRVSAELLEWYKKYGANGLKED